MSRLDPEFEILEYDRSWPSAFEAEAARIRGALGSLALRVDHNGSTSVPGLAAKPIIDIQVSVAELHLIRKYEVPLRSIGYVHVVDPDDSFCPFFHKPNQWPHTHHIHVVEHGGFEERRTLAFRDYLRDHANSAREYEKLKKDIAGRLTPRDRESREAYAQAKTDFIERIIAIALGSGFPLEFISPGEARTVVDE